MVREANFIFARVAFTMSNDLPLNCVCQDLCEETAGDFQVCGGVCFAVSLARILPMFRYVLTN